MSAGAEAARKEAGSIGDGSSSCRRAVFRHYVLFPSGKGAGARANPS